MQNVDNFKYLYALADYGLVADLFEAIPERVGTILVV
jgi:electron transfer flavoprotein alpha subunit